jgi:hypothetical protein
MSGRSGDGGTSATEQVKQIREEHTRMLDHADAFLKLHPYLNELMNVMYFQEDGHEWVELGCHQDVGGIQHRFGIIFFDSEESNYQISVGKTEPDCQTGEPICTSKMLASFNEPVFEGETPSKVQVTPQQLIEFLRQEGFLDHLSGHERAELAVGNFKMIPARPKEW